MFGAVFEPSLCETLVPTATPDEAENLNVK